MNMFVKIPLIWLLAQYVAGPILVRLSLKAPARYSMSPLDWDSVTAFKSADFLTRNRALLELGFFPVAATKTDGIDAAFYLRNADSTIASLMVSSTNIATEFTQVYEAGTNLDVTNSSSPAVHPSWQRKIGYRFPRRRDTHALHNAFQKIRDRVDLGEAKHLVNSDVLKCVEDFVNEELEHLVSIGFYSKNVTSGKRNVTLKGACLMTWRLAWPLKPLLLFIAERQGERALA